MAKNNSAEEQRVADKNFQAKEMEPADKGTLIEMPDEPQMWQVIFETVGHGEQVAGMTEEGVRAEMAKKYGEDYPVKSCYPLKQ